MRGLMSVDVLKGDIVVRSEKDGTVIIHMNREDLFDFYMGISGKVSYDNPYAVDEVISLIKRFFVHNEDASTEPNLSPRFFD